MNITSPRPTRNPQLTDLAAAPSVVPTATGGAMDLTQLTIREAAAALQRAEITAEAYADALLARAAQAAALNAFIHHDPAQVRASSASA